MRLFAVLLVSVVPAIILYLIVAWRVRRVTYLGDGTRITWFPLLPGIWSEEGPVVTTGLPWEDRAERIERIIAHLKRARQIKRAWRRYMRSLTWLSTACAALAGRVREASTKVSEVVEAALRS